MFQDLRGLLVFAHVVETKSFSAAAARLGVTKSAVSKLVAGLEKDLGVQLLVRTTRKLALTDVGERVYESCARLASDVEAAEQAAASHRSMVVGQLRVTAPAVLGRKYLVPLVTEFLSEHPKLSIELDLGDRYVDIVEERIDVAFRVGRAFSDSSLRARRIVDVPLRVCASPEYLRRRGTPGGPAELAGHEWILHGRRNDAERVTFSRGKSSLSVKVSGRFACNDGAATVEAAVAGRGLVIAPEIEVGHEIARGALVSVLDGWSLEGLSLSALSPPGRHTPNNVRAFVDFVVEKWRRPPWKA
jgi:DNA-binding transcriptional LysR family regulator